MLYKCVQEGFTDRTTLLLPPGLQKNTNPIFPLKLEASFADLLKYMRNMCLRFTLF